MSAFRKDDESAVDDARGLTDEAIEIQIAIAQRDGNERAVEFLRLVAELFPEQRRVVYHQVALLAAYNAGATHVGPPQVQ